MSEEALLRGLQGLLPEEPTFNGQTNSDDRGIAHFGEGSGILEDA